MQWGGWLDAKTEKQQFDLLSLRDGVSGSLVSQEALPADDYCELRVIIAEDATMLLESGETVPLKIPSGQSSGIKLKGRIPIIPGLETTVVVDFDAKESIERAGKKYVMNPVLRIQDVKYSGALGTFVTGATLVDWTTFTLAPETQGVVHLPNGATLTFQAGSVSETKVFTVAAWDAGLSDALTLTYTFSPHQDFLIPPTFSAPLTHESPGGVVLWDLEMLNKTMSVISGQSVAASPVPHFSCGVVSPEPFIGLPSTEWYSDPILSLDSRGVFNRDEFDANYFDPATGAPSKSILREQVVAMLARAVFKLDASKLGTPATKPFNDVETTDRFAAYIAKLKAMGVIKGCGDGKFCYGKTLNWAEMAKLVVESIAYAGNSFPLIKATKYQSTPILGTGNETEFSDVHCAPGTQCDWYYGYVYGARFSGLMRGYPDGSFRPANPINRVEVAKIACFLAYGADCQVCGLTFDKVRNAYWPETGLTFAEKVGGNLLARYEAGEFENLCAVHLSQAFNVAGIPILTDFPGPDGNIVTGKDGYWYAYRSSDFIPWLTERFGTPKVVSKAEREPFDMSSFGSGVVYFEVDLWQPYASGHVDLVDADGHCVGNCLWHGTDPPTPYENLATKLYFWPIP